MYTLHFHPRREFRGIKRNIQNLVADFLEQEPFLASGLWIPPIDIIETDDSYLVTVELPGVNQDDVQIRIQGEKLTISGERKSRQHERRHFRKERFEGPFSRTIALPGPVDQSKVTAKYNSGILEITLPKHEKNVGRDIKIEGA
ncbi:MAG: Hsp20/alpha crystallin family protein [candidate division KSB1 bacterium]|nr:Hsp20/alpha crystallin family protein [candidate division KSB1 bacterium]